MQQSSLNGSWQLCLIYSPQTNAPLVAGAWHPAIVAGGVHTDLMAAGLIRDPFVGDNERSVQWVAESDWQYRRTFHVDADLLAEERVTLVCDGLDTLAQVELNGRPVGQAENMFCQHRWEIKSLLQPAGNEIVVTFCSPTRFCAERQAERPLIMANDALPGAPYLRKAPCHFGWDWGPKLPPIGIWRDIRLEGCSTARLADVHVRQHHADGKVQVTVNAQVERWSDTALVAAVSITAPDGQVVRAATPVQADTATLTIPIENPQLWWPNGYGAQPLYKVKVEVKANSSTLASTSYAIGLRTIELRQAPDAWGRSFTFIVNGVPIFAKGSNWIPADSFPARVTGEHLERLVAAAAATNQNMLRVWGGGYYEDERFYDLCDRYGILVWQDFMFACAIYPLNDAVFVENVRQEVIENVRRLRHRACLALWCGNNEMEAGWVGWGWDQPDRQDLKAADQKFFYDTLPAWVAGEDPDHAYWPSSPSSGMPHQVPGSHAMGDDHLWSVWHANKPLHFYRQELPRFVSEFGFQSLPPLGTVATYAEPAEWNMTSYVMELHQRNASGNGKIITYLAEHYRMPADFPWLVYLTQVLQAEAIRTGVEHWRRHRDRCSGALYWQLNDCWPVASWSSIDYFGRWKALHYATRRFYAPVLLSIEDKGEQIGLFVTNDTVQLWRGEVHWSLETLTGAALATGIAEVNAAPLATTPICDLDFASLVNDENRRHVVFVAELRQDEVAAARSVTLFAPDKHLALEMPEIEAEVMAETGADTLSLRLTGRSLARFVELALEGVDVIFSDNYFDLPAGRAVMVRCPLPHGWSVTQAAAALRVRSLRESY